MPQRTEQGLGGTAIGRSVLDMAARENLTIRQTYERVLPAMSGNMVKGTPTHVADVLEEWYRQKACDGFVLSMPVQPRSTLDFITHVIPELRRRGLRPPQYPGRTLRENLGLPIPPDPFTAISQAAN
jgi:alkanesulfonate monooxygenase SsuD/methylene tetrahydromethanopterin reductase-like flavin-dependent oxidoreductase (luciferase family)